MNQEQEEKPQDLVARIRAGDRTAEEALIARYSRGVLAMLRQRVSDWELAADLHQDAFVVVLQRLRDGELDHPERLAAFIRQTAINLHIAEYRKQRRRNTHPDAERVAETADASAGPVAQLQHSERSELLRQLIDELRVERDRVLLRRYYLAEQTKTEICAALELDSVHFDRVLFRARERLKALVQESVSAGDHP